MDLKKNGIPDHVKTIHLVAVCGTAMGALACMLKELGYEVTGSDHRMYPPMSDFLKEKGIRAFDGFSADNLSYGPDLVVIGNAISKDNPEAVATRDMGLWYCSMPQAVNRFAVAGRKSVVVTGTHGKTTTSSLMAMVLYEAGLDPGFMIGGILKNFNSNYRTGNGPYISIEGDEYDTAFFDKGPKFLHYHPHIAILTSVEFDHADIFADFHQVCRVFDAFLSQLAPESTLIAYDGDKVIEELIRDRRCSVFTYGKNKTSGWRLSNLSIEPPFSIFDVIKNGIHYGTFQTRLMGEHNVLNAIAVIAAADRIGITPAIIQQALERFTSVKRRQEVRGVKNGITVIDDFAHHPTAVRETIKAISPFYPEGRLIAVFEPRTNTSMRNIFQDVYPACFDDADLICIRKPPLLEKIPEGERFSSKKLVEDLKDRKKDAFYFENTDDILQFLKKTARSGDAILIMSNGGFDNIHQRLIEAL
ncbi:MAG: UDP-N-acetylmuramate:L-alanyl-gamma-D-glutamyl-meso-diaminopimelate ligase [Pseudomonadota bacterium]